jgi:5-(hydroxymethyl)furfural/furfural oxidase
LSHARIVNDYTRRHIYLALRYSSKLDGIPPGDMFTVVTNKTSWHAVGEQIGSFIITVYKTYSETGEVKLADWHDEPIVDFNLLSGSARSGWCARRTSGLPMRWRARWMDRRRWAPG